eukprot:TRINITY_DN4977_c0_g2_i2.p1 TRINITY_DN4977_c0_g2~~TRINITY_DN4977_c0_g2_i2.p1  ORF type:complete len:187 (-),score=47.73 TRINITY_DN4977_c0_g2_i2:123-683(-)
MQDAVSPQRRRIRDYNQYLRDNLYPHVQAGLEKLVEYLLTTNEIQEHAEKLKQQKILDRLEQKRLLKEKDRQELGSDYESSGESIDMDDDEVHEKRPNQSSLPEDFMEAQQGSDKNLSMLKEEEFEKPDLQVVQEDQEDLLESARGTGLAKEEERHIYNPIEHLGHLLKEIAQQRRFKPVIPKKSF